MDAAGRPKEGGGSPGAPGSAAGARDLIQLVVFRVGSEEYAVDILRMKEIINPLRITPVPRAPSFVEGVVELRGTILPVVDMRKRFGLPAKPLGRRGKYIIVGIRGRVVGLIVDGVVETLRLPRAELRPPPALMEGAAAAEYFAGVCYLGGRILMVLDLDRVLAPHERDSLGGPATAQPTEEKEER
jgi:purine-binding chemotaxis protein CheW